MEMVISSLLISILSSGITASQYLETAEDAMMQEQWPTAIAIYNQAIDSEVLSSGPGKVIAFWGLAASYNAIDDIDNAADSLLKFIIYSIDVMDYVESIPEDKRANNNYIAWVNDFKLPLRMTMASRTIQWYWGTRFERKKQKLHSGDDKVSIQK